MFATANNPFQRRGIVIRAYGRRRRREAALCTDRCPRNHGYPRAAAVREV